MAKYKKRRRHKKLYDKKIRKENNRNNCHHMLYQRRYWEKGYAKLLREHPYFKIMIPIHTLHEQIHRELSLIPKPSETSCRNAWLCFSELYNKGDLSLDDKYSDRLNILIYLWKDSDKDTVTALLYEKEIILSFYKENHS